MHLGPQSLAVRDHTAPEPGLEVAAVAWRTLDETMGLEGETAPQTDDP